MYKIKKVRTIYMYSIDEIVARLAKGESCDTIADEMADVLNKAVQQTKEKEDKDQKVAEKAASVLNEIKEYIALKDPALWGKVKDSFNAMEPSDFAKDLDDLIVSLQTLIELQDYFKPLKSKKTDRKSKDKDSETLTDFLKEWGLE